MSKNLRQSYGIGSPLADMYPTPIIAQRAPAVTDLNYPIGQIWISQATDQSWILTSVGAGSATWALSSPGASDVDTINSLSPVAGDILIAGGTNLSVVNGGNTVTLNMDPAITLATSITSPIYTAVAALDINAPAGSNVTIQLGDALGANILEIENSASAAVATISSLGIGTFVGIDGILGGVTPAAITGTTIVANTSVTSPIYTSVGAVDTSINAVAGQDIILKMGDAAGANKVSFQTDAAAEVFAIDSTGTATFAGLTVTGAFEQTAGQVDIGMDNLGSAINIGGGNVAKALSIGGGAGAHTIAIGSAAAGDITLDTAGGFSLDAATASNITVTGAGLDLSLQGVGGAVNMTSDQAENDAILIEASAANGGVQIKAGTGGILIGNEADTTAITLGLTAPTASRTITIGGGTVVTAAVTDLIKVGSDGATTNANSIKQVDVNTGGVTLGEVLTNIGTGAVTSGTHTVSIQSGNVAAGTVATNISTGTGTKTVNVGNADAGTTINLDGVVVINTNVNSTFSANVGTSTGTVTLGNIANSGAMSLESSSTIDLDSAGAIGINSTGAEINIGNDDIDQAVNVGTDGERTVTVGSTNGAAALVLQSGTGEITVTGTVKEIDAEFLSRSGDDITFTASPICQSSANTGVAPTGADTDLNILSFPEGIIMEQYIIGTNTIICPRMDATGLLTSLDLTAAEGFELNFGATRANSRHSYTIGTSPAFFFELSFTVADVTGCEPFYFGFRKTQANQSLYSNYTDFVGYGLNNLVAGGDCVIGTQLNTGGLNSTDTNDAFADGATHTLQVLVSAAGVVTFTFDGGAPTATQAYTFDNGDVVHPYIHSLFGAGAPGTIHLQSMKIGYQA